MSRTYRLRWVAGLAPVLAAVGALAIIDARPAVTSPKQQFGFEIGDDYRLATYAQLVDYWTKLDGESDRMTVTEIGRTAEGRPQLMAIITSPENHRKLQRFKEIARRLAFAEGLTDDQARALAAEGRAVVWIDGGLHATEVLGGQQLIELVYQMVGRNDAETLRFLDDVILLAVHANPDGQDLVANWYMGKAKSTDRSLTGLPRLYQKYIGHDNNRDFYMSTQAETANMNRVLYREWLPQIVYDHHQTGPAGTVLFAPPFRDPFNYQFDPLVPIGINLVGAAMHGRFAAEHKPGATMRGGGSYSTWWNGGLRTTAYFHNMIGLLTETIGSPTPIEIPLVVGRQLPSGNLPYPVAPQSWHFRQSIDYSITANRAVLDVASRFRETFLFNIYRMGRNAIEKGSRDAWTMSPWQIAAVEEAMAGERHGARDDGRGSVGVSGAAAAKYLEMLRDPAKRDPRGYILPSDQPDFLTATRLVDALLKTGVVVHRATDAFTAGGRAYPAGSYVVKTAQAFRPHVLDMFEPQAHPDDIPYPGGPPSAPYDVAGWTLAYQMGVVFDRVLEGFEGPFERVGDTLAPPPGSVVEATPAVGYLLDHRVNDAFLATNRLLAAGEQVYWIRDALNDGDLDLGPGAIFIPRRATTTEAVQRAAADLGLVFRATSKLPVAPAYQLRPIRIGLWDRYGGSIPSGWLRWLFEQYEFPFEVVYPSALDGGNLAARYDVLVFAEDAIPAGIDNAETMPTPDAVPAEFRDRLGRVTVTKTVPRLAEFLEAGGTVITFGPSTALAAHLGLPVTSALTEVTADGPRPLPREKFYVPGSILRVAVDNSSPLAYGMGTTADVFFDDSPVFRLLPGAAQRGLGPVAWFDGPSPLRSGWARGQQYLDGGTAIAEARVGRGRLLLFGPKLTFRAQSHGTFKFLFNGVYWGSAREVRLAEAL